MIRRLRRFLAFGLMALAVAGLANSQKTPAWKGKIAKEGDVVVVTNPRQPMYGPMAFSLLENLAIGGQEDPESVLAEIRSVTVNSQGVIYILDWKDVNVKVFGPEGKHLTTFGKAGQGPGEFDRPLSVQCLATDEIVVSCPSRLSFFGPKGDLRREIPSGGLVLMDTRLDSSGDIFGFDYVMEATGGGNYELCKFDSALKKLSVVETSPLPNVARDGFDPFFPVLRWAMLPGDQMVCGYAAKPELSIHDVNGRLIRKILMDVESIPIAEQDIKERTAGTPPDIIKNMKVPKYYPSFRYIVADDEGKIYVLSWERPPGRKGYYFDVFDAEGKYIVRSVIPVIGPYIRRGFLYASEETSDGYPVLKRYKIRWNL
jgi:hypothetical protein